MGKTEDYRKALLNKSADFSAHDLSGPDYNVKKNVLLSFYHILSISNDLVQWPVSQKFPKIFPSFLLKSTVKYLKYWDMVMSCILFVRVQARRGV